MSEEHGAVVLALDPGGKRVGVASAGPLGIATPVCQLAAEPADRLFAQVLELAQTRGATLVVVGLPLDMDGSEGPSARRARSFGNALALATGLVVVFQDERQTSMLADARLARSGLTRLQKKRRRDAIAAVAILEAYLERHRN